MKFEVRRKLNLANIDKEIWPYETEDIGVTDADSFEEAQKVVDRSVSERIGYYKAKAEEYHKSKSAGISVPMPAPAVAAPAVSPSTHSPAPASPAGSTNGMPDEFKI